MLEIRADLDGSVFKMVVDGDGDWFVSLSKLSCFKRISDNRICCLLYTSDAAERR